jgi:hypothetical protein
MSPATVTIDPSGLPRPRSAPRSGCRRAGQDVLDAEQRVVGDVEAEHLALEGEQRLLVPLDGGHGGQADMSVSAAPGVVAEGAEEAVLPDRLLLLDRDEASTYSSWTRSSPAASRRGRRRHRP